MRLLTHNFLKSNVKGTENGYPLNIEVTTIRYDESPVDKEFVLNMLPKVNYAALRLAVQQINSSQQQHCNNDNDDKPSQRLPELPEELDVTDKETLANLNQDTICDFHRVLFDVYLVEGWLVCPDTGRKFPVKECIPNMILHEDEI